MRIDKNDNKANKIVEIKLNVPGKAILCQETNLIPLKQLRTKQ